MKNINIVYKDSIYGKRKIEMKIQMNIFLVAILVVAIIIFFVKALQTPMSHRMYFYHHSEAQNQDDLEKDFLKNQLKVKEDNIEIEPQTQVLSEEDAFVRCHVPTLNTQQCWQSRFFECPVTNGSYAQCTNNYMRLPKEGNAPCETGRAGFEMAPPKLKISENCYYQSTGLLSQQNQDMNKNLVI